MIMRQFGIGTEVIFGFMFLLMAITTGNHYTLRGHALITIPFVCHTKNSRTENRFYLGLKEYIRDLNLSMMDCIGRYLDGQRIINQLELLAIKIG